MNKLNDIDKKIYAAAAQYIKKFPIPEKFKEQHPKWNFELIERLGVGSIDSFTNFKNYIKKIAGKSVTETRLKDAGINNPQLFSPNNVIFILTNNNGYPIGFIGRKADHSENAQWNIWNGPHYEHHKYLYGLRDAALSENGSLYIVEGYTDLLSMRSNGIENAVALGSNTFSYSHYSQIKNHGFKNIILCMDTDKDGYDTTEAILETIRTLGGANHISILSLEKHKDVDEYFQDHTIDEFNKLKPLNVLDWKLQFITKDDFQKDPIISVTKLIPYVLFTTNFIKKGEMAKQLSELSGIAIDKIESEIARQEGLQIASVKEQIGDMKDSFIRKARTMTDEQFMEEVSVLNDSIREIVVDRNMDVEPNQIQVLKKFIDQWTTKEEKIEGVKCFCPVLTEAINGIPIAKDCMFIGGTPNTGKSSLVTSIVSSIFNPATGNSIKKLNETTFMLFSIDDPKETYFSRLLSTVTSTPTRILTNPRWHAPEIDPQGNLLFETVIKNGEKVRLPIIDREITAKLKAGEDEVFNWMRKDWFQLYDAADGNTLHYMEARIKAIRKVKPYQNICIIIDNFHNLGDYPGLEDKAKFTNISKNMATMMARYNVAFICTVEMTKEARGGNRPTGKHMAESRAMEYLSKCNIVLFNELHELKKNAELFSLRNDMGDPTDLSNKRPIIEGNIDKNKMGNFKGDIYYHFWDDIAKFEQIPISEVKNFKHEKV